MTRHFFNVVASSTMQKGFSLVELSVIITIAASATIGFLAWTQPSSQTNAQNAAITIVRMQEIQKALENFRVMKKRLPCPADPLMRSDNTRAAGDSYDNPTSTNLCAGPTGRLYDCYLNDFGQEDLFTTHSLTSGSITQLTPGSSCPSPVGAVPVFALGLDESYINDGWGRRFTYHVSPSLCGTDGQTAALASANGVGCTAKDYQNKSGTLVVKSAIAAGSSTLVNNAAYVLVSHGSNGYGAFLPSGAKLTVSTNLDELKNNGGSSTTNYVKADKGPNFDDIVFFETKNMIESMTNRTNIKNISVANCETNSQAIRNLTLTETAVMKTFYTSQKQNYNSQDPDNYQNKGDQALLSVLWATQSVCIAYYGAAAATINNQIWHGAQCPGNTTSVSTYDESTNSCSCANGRWDGSCIKSPVLPTDYLGLVLWLDAADNSSLYTNSNCSNGSSPVNGNSIGCWKDKSGSNYHATDNETETNPPLYATNIINNLPVIRFSGTGNKGLTINTLSLAKPYSIFLLNRYYSSTTGRTLQSISKNWLFGMHGGSYAYYDSTAWVAAGIAAIDTWYLLSTTNNGISVAAYVNGVDFTNDSSRIGEPDSLAFGYSGYYKDQPSDADIAELIIYKPSLSNTDRKAVEAYLSAKWGVTVTP